MEIKILASGSSGNCAYISQDGAAPLLLDCGISINAIKKGCGFSLSKAAACLITHEHKDHAQATYDLMKAGIDCYMSRGTADSLRVSGHRTRIVEARQQLQTGEWTVLPFDVVHDAAEPLGFLLASGENKVLYAIDTCYIPYRFNGLTHVLLGCNYQKELLNESVITGERAPILRDRIMRSHMSLDTALEFFAANDLSKVREIHLLHLSDIASDAAKMKHEVQRMTGKPVYV